MADTTMVKAEVEEPTNEYIERVQERGDMNKQEATAWILRAHAMSATEAEAVNEEKMNAYLEHHGEADE